MCCLPWVAGESRRSRAWTGPESRGGPNCVGPAGWGIEVSSLYGHRHPGRPQRCDPIIVVGGNQQCAGRLDRLSGEGAVRGDGLCGARLSRGRNPQHGRHATQRRHGVALPQPHRRTNCRPDRAAVPSWHQFHVTDTQDQGNAVDAGILSVLRRHTQAVRTAQRTCSGISSERPAVMIGQSTYPTARVPLVPRCADGQPTRSLGGPPAIVWKRLN